MKIGDRVRSDNSLGCGSITSVYTGAKGRDTSAWNVLWDSGWDSVGIYEDRLTLVANPSNELTVDACLSSDYIREQAMKTVLVVWINISRKNSKFELVESVKVADGWIYIQRLSKTTAINATQVEWFEVIEN